MCVRFIRASPTSVRQSKFLQISHHYPYTSSLHALQFVNEELPFGGVGNSGLGKYHGKYSFDAFSHEKAVYDKSIAVDVGLRYAPRNKRKDAMFEALMNLDIFGLIKHYFS